MAPLVIRPTDRSELRAAAAVLQVSLLGSPPDDVDWERHEQGWFEQHSLSAWDGATCVGHGSTFPFSTLVPGGEWLRTAGVTRVGVVPTHTRLGILTALIAELLDEARSRGDVLASLRASETTIYGRYGFGVAGHAVSSRIDVGRVRPLANADPGGLRLVVGEQLLDVVPPIYEKIEGRAGMISRAPWMWRRYLEHAIGGTGSNTVVVHTSPSGVDDGFAHYSLAWADRGDGIEEGLGHVHEVRGRTPEVELALWSYLLDIDLVRTYVVQHGPADDVLHAAARDTRAVRTTARFDEQWLRVLDVASALGARAWAPSAPVTIEVHDDRFADNCRRWRIGSEGVEATSGPADLVTDIAALSAAYLGSTSWWELAATGRAQPASPAALSRADALFAVRPPAYCGSFF